MDSGPSVTPLMRAAVALVVAAAIIFIVGVLGTLVAAGLRLTTGHHQAAGGAPWAVGTAENIAVIGLAIGLGALVLVLPGMAAGRAGRLLRPPVLRLRRLAAHDPGPGMGASVTAASVTAASATAASITAASVATASVTPASVTTASVTAAESPPQPAAGPQPQFTAGPVAGQDGQPEHFPAST